MNNKTQHTPGPWDVAISVDCLDETSYKFHGKVSEEEEEANARLIAAAPDLLAALEAVAALNEGQGQANLCEVAGRARAALLKARGE